ncbi:MAG: DUF4124 domain-containing protein [Gammaproteobacteria bacterium]|nr:DUF4124 domain-containing protein [Gammaproteobacteria bacterium]
MRIVLLMTLMIIAGSASAGLYKWVDNEGNVHYSQKPPRDKQYKSIKAPSAAPENSKPLYQSTTKKKKTSINTGASESQKNEKIRAKNCENAKKRLNVYQVYRRVKDADGNIKTVDDNERTKQIKQAKQAISDFCN